MSVYLDDAEMAGFLGREGLVGCSDAELLIIADLFDRLGHAESSCGAWFMRYSILGFVAERRNRRAAGQDLEPAGDPLALENFLGRNPALRTGQCPIPEMIKLEISKSAKFTAEELRKIEDAVKKDIDGQDELRQAVAYAYLNGLGWRMTKAQQIIDKALK